MKRPPLNKLRRELISSMLHASAYKTYSPSSLAVETVELSPFNAVRVAEEHLTLRNLLRLWLYRARARWWYHVGGGRSW